MWVVHLPKRVVREFEVAPAALKEPLREALKTLQYHPRPVGCKKLAGRLQSWRIRVGTYRILYDILDRKRAVVITKIGPRKDVYRHLR